MSNPENNICISLLTEAVSVAREAGEALLSFFRHPGLHVDPKLCEADIVTEADRASEAIILDYLRRQHPTHAILSEESGASGSAEAEWEWVIDPLDGTTNFSEGLPTWAVSIGIRRHGKAVAGVVHAPYLRETFTAIRGGGAQLNGATVHCRRNELMERAVVSTGFPVDKAVNPDNNVAELVTVLPLVRGMRRLGSAALDLSYVGAGFLDGYWEMNLHEWDVCAGELIATEGGALCRRYRSDRNVSLCAATPAIFNQLYPLLSDVSVHKSTPLSD